jgi:hypothetical protein
VNFRGGLRWWKSETLVSKNSPWIYNNNNKLNNKILTGKLKIDKARDVEVN